MHRVWEVTYNLIDELRCDFTMVVEALFAGRLQVRNYTAKRVGSVPNSGISRRRCHASELTNPLVRGPSGRNVHERDNLPLTEHLVLQYGPERL